MRRSKPSLRREDQVGERGLRDRHHVPRAERHPGHLPLRLLQRFPHHLGDVGGDRVGPLLHRDHGELAEGDPVGKRGFSELRGGRVRC